MFKRNERKDKKAKTKPTKKKRRRKADEQCGLNKPNAL